MGSDEDILVVPRALLLPEPVHGFSTDNPATYLARVRAHGFFARRGDVEGDPSLKQIIPYLIVRHNGRIFLFQRSAAGGEARLHDKYSIGVGMTRELKEELAINGRWRAHLAGILNDDTNPVGQVHFGLVHVVEVESADVQPREADFLSGELASPDTIRSLHDRMEPLSQLILDATDPLTL